MGDRLATRNRSPSTVNAKESAHTDHASQVAARGFLLTTDRDDLRFGGHSFTTAAPLPVTEAVEPHGLASAYSTPPHLRTPAARRRPVARYFRSPSPRAASSPGLVHRTLPGVRPIEAQPGLEEVLVDRLDRDGT